MYDLAILGGGPAGYVAAENAGAKGLKTILFEKRELGGVCLNEGCIPTKTLLYGAKMYDHASGSKKYGVTAENVAFEYKKMADRKTKVVRKLVAGIKMKMENIGVEVVKGEATIVRGDAASITIACGGESYEAARLLICTGSEAFVPPIPGVDGNEAVLTNREILALTQAPESLIIIGGGVIGLEFASVFRSFGSEVTVLEYFKEILPRFDSDLSKRLKQSLGKRGIEISTQTQVTAIEECDGKYKVSFTRKGKEEFIEADKVLMAVGRKANVDSLNLADVGIEFTPRGIVVDDKTMQTNIPHIYAVGDINGKMMLAHAATFQGIVALDHIMGVENGIDLSMMPAAVFTSPEAASVGMTEEDCKAAGVSVKCLKSFFRANGKAVTMGETDGFCKVIVAAEPKDGGETPYEPGRILGCHLYGPHASDIVQEACALITRKATLAQFEDIIHTHPTLTEVLQSAVHN